MSQANKLEDQLVDELIDENQQLCRIPNSSAKTAKEKLKRGK